MGKVVAAADPGQDPVPLTLSGQWSVGKTQDKEVNGPHIFMTSARTQKRD